MVTLINDTKGMHPIRPVIENADLNFVVPYAASKMRLVSREAIL